MEARKILKASWHLTGGQTSVDIGDGRFTGLGLKTKRRQVYRFGPQNLGRIRCGRMTMVVDNRHQHQACVEAKESREGGVSVRWSSKNLDRFTPKKNP